MKAINTTLFQNTSKNGFLKAEPNGDTFLGFKKPNQIIYSLYSDNNWVCDFIAEIGSNISLEKEYKENSNVNIIVLKADGKIVASITYIEINLFTYSNQPCVELFNVATLTSYRRKGFNEKIMDYILKEIKEITNEGRHVVIIDLNKYKLEDNVMDKLKLYNVNIQNDGSKIHIYC